MKKTTKGKKIEIDYRKGQKVIATIKIEDKGQDFTELDVLQNGVLLGNSPMFSNGRLSLLGIGTRDGIEYQVFKEFSEMDNWPLGGQAIYMKKTGKKDPFPWNADILNYSIVEVKKPIKSNRFIK